MDSEFAESSAGGGSPSVYTDYFFYHTQRFMGEVLRPLADRTGNRRLVSGGILLCIALAARWTRLAHESLWFDEGWTWWLVMHPAGDMFRLMRADVVAPLYFYVLHFWSAAFGDSVLALRTLSALFATLALLPWLTIARQTLATKAGLFVAAGLASVAFMQEQYAREARPYALMGLLTLGAMAFLPTLAARRSWPALIGFALLIAAGLYTHNTTGFYAASLAMAWLVWPGERPLRGRLIDLALVVAVAAVLYAPWLPTLREQARWVRDNFWVSRPRLGDACVAASAVSGVDVDGVATFLWPVQDRSAGGKALAKLVTVAAGIAVAVSMLTRDLTARRRAIAVAIVAFAPLVFVFALSQIAKPIFLPRLFVASSALTPLIFGMAYERCRPALACCVGVAAVTLLAACGVVSVVVDLTTMQKDDWASAYASIASLPPSSKRLLVFVPAEGELPYAHRAMLDSSRAAEPRTGIPQGFFDLDPPRTLQRISRSGNGMDALARRLAGGAFEEVVLIMSHQTHVDPDGLGKAWLDGRWRQVDDTNLRNVRLIRYVPR